MAKNAAKQLLDELMGRERDLGPNQKKSTLIWNDPNVLYLQLLLYNFIIN